MKIPLRYQISEYDCGTISMLNAISYLYDREEVPPDVVYNINKFTLDEFGYNGEERRGGTSTSAMRYLAHWLNSFSAAKKFDVHCEILSQSEASLYSDKVKNFMRNGGVIIPRIWSGGYEHYALITKMDDRFAYIFDPYYDPTDEYDDDKHVEMEDKKEREYNRVVTIERIMNGTNEDYSLVSNKNRELVLITRK